MNKMPLLVFFSHRHGTTDITRTRHMSTCSAEQRDTFTRALQGQLGLAAAVFPRGVKVSLLSVNIGLAGLHGFVVDVDKLI